MSRLVGGSVAEVVAAVMLAADRRRVSEAGEKSAAEAAA